MQMGFPRPKGRRAKAKAEVLELQEDIKSKVSNILKVMEIRGQIKTQFNLGECAFQEDITIWVECVILNP